MLGEALQSRAWRYVEPARNGSVDERVNGDAVRMRIRREWAPRMSFPGGGSGGEKDPGRASVGGAWAAGAVGRRVACSRRDGAHHGRREHGRDGAAPTSSTVGPESREMRRPIEGE